MFTFAKFVGSALGFLTVSSKGAVVAPVTFTDSLHKTGKNAKGHFDLAGLKNEEHKLKTRLDSLKTDFSKALLATEASKNYKLKKIQEKFDELKSKEESLRKQYEEITEEIKKISDLLTKESEASKRKLNSESALSLLKVYEKHFETISKHFSDQKQNVLEIVCTIDKTIKKQEIQSGQVCADESWKKTLESPSQAGQNQVAAGGGIVAEYRTESLRRSP
ncbi:hypothetical protein MHLP_03250 [Candidatus Mycoplasma haematolamae str. Purdue]|uniref:Uncharacterized protein n=1 Tax=Mycoplasma haematolamae (strain Purdue) TaxID=1212765 RepID=I7BAB0_MYCHA|nr:hypothetical protein [Candidatus Mycoplasma haematolamae]AFO52230.1 hypothetical protein MHLP_03250 [Candidatus Mycoplasma haematolamae str. Purdue]